jgi:hypothetical protein
MIRRIIITFTSLAISLASFSQPGYILEDSSKTTGVTIVFGKETDNWKTCQVRTASGTKSYSPSELSGYGVPGYKTFVTRKVKIDGEICNAFLEQLVLGKTNLYFMRNQEKRLFFIEGGTGELVLLDRRKDALKSENYRNELLRFFNDDPEFRKYAPYYSFNKSSLSQLVNMYNMGQYRPNGLSRGGIVIHAGGETVFSPVNIHPDLVKIKMYNQMNFFAGLFYETAAIGSNISLRPEFLLSHTVYGFNGVAPGTILDVTVKSTSVEIPCIIKFVMPGRHFRPFINGGGMIRIDFNDQRSAYYYQLNDGWARSQYLQNPHTTQMCYAITGGVGLQYFFNIHRSIDIELRLNGMMGNTSITSTHPVQLVASYSLF